MTTILNATLPNASTPQHVSNSTNQVKCSSLRAAPLNISSNFVSRRKIYQKLSLQSLQNRRGSVVVRASSDQNPSEKPRDDKIGPLSPESPSGQLLVQLLKSHPHLFPAAVDQELEKLSADRESSDDVSQTKTGNELTLYKRISEVRENERKRAIEEVIYALIVQRFIEAGSPLLPKVPFISELEGGIMTSASARPNVKELESVHSAEAVEMVRDHLMMLLGRAQDTSPFPIPEDRIVLPSSKLRLGQIYAASIMYGYFLRRVDQRFQLEKTMRALTGDVNIQGALESEFIIVEQPESKSDSLSQEPKDETRKMGKLRAYVTSFDSETLQKASTLRSKEGLSVIESHTEALFGRPQLMISQDGSVVLPKDDSVRVTAATLRRLVLEAIAFGSFLWDIESYVDSQYKIVS